MSLKFFETIHAYDIDDKEEDDIRGAWGDFDAFSQEIDRLRNGKDSNFRTIQAALRELAETAIALARHIERKG